MRLLQSTLVSLNGVASRPHEWVGPHFGPASAARSLATVRHSSAMLMGRGTYEVFSKLWPSGTGEYAEHVNAMRKVVFSNTLREPEWNNTTVEAGDVVESVTAMKAEPGADLLVYGHGRFGQTLVDAGLVDELTIIVIPVFVDGEPFFRPGGRTGEWRLADTERVEADTVALTYHPVRDA